MRDRCLVHVCLAGDSGMADALTALTALNAERTADRDCLLALAPPSAADDDVHGGYAGLPDPDDRLFLRKTGHCARCLDAGRGLLMFLPVVPFEGASIVRAADLIRGPHGRTAEPGVTMNVLGPDAVNHVVTLGFPVGDPLPVRDAHRTLDRLHRSFAAEGFHPYRPDIDRPVRQPPGGTTDPGDGPPGAARAVYTIDHVY
ncbi:hypothetical protein ACIA8J_03905 [Streptomyces asoensis]|uniref:hypothetical protein n=1 Tax=Streptomyces asoensis TaxID=249586 RepID=UPI003798808A